MSDKQEPLGGNIKTNTKYTFRVVDITGTVKSIDVKFIHDKEHPEFPIMHIYKIN